MEIMQTLWCIFLGVQFLTLVGTWVLCIKYVRLRRRKDSEYYTDYTHKGVILRIYKPEFEYQAIGEVPRDKLLDMGVFSQYYKWALIEL